MGSAPPVCKREKDGLAPIYLSEVQSLLCGVECHDSHSQNTTWCKKVNSEVDFTVKLRSRPDRRQDQRTNSGTLEFIGLAAQTESLAGHSERLRWFVGGAMQFNATRGVTGAI